MKKDLRNMLEVPVKSLDVGAVETTTAGAQADLKGFHSCVFIVDADARTDGTHTIHLEESDTSGSGFTDVAAADLIFTEAGGVTSAGQVLIDGAADDDQAYVIGYKGSKRYVRVSADVTTATTGAIYGAMIVRGHKRADGKIVS